MPFTAVENDRAALKSHGLFLELRSVDYTSERIDITFESEDDVHFQSVGDLVFPRAPGEVALTDFHIWHGERSIAYDKLKRPILLRKGERATFEPGGIRLELK